MRFFEFADTNSGVDKFILILKSEIYKYARRRTRAVLNWSNVAVLAKKSGFEFISDPISGYETFKELYDTTPMLQELVKDFNESTIELNVPGVSGSDIEDDGVSSQDNVDQIAASAAPGQLEQ